MEVNYFLKNDIKMGIFNRRWRGAQRTAQQIAQNAHLQKEADGSYSLRADADPNLTLVSEELNPMGTRASAWDKLFKRRKALMTMAYLQNMQNETAPIGNVTSKGQPKNQPQGQPKPKDDETVSQIPAGYYDGLDVWTGYPVEQMWQIDQDGGLSYVGPDTPPGDREPAPDQEKPADSGQPLDRPPVVQQQEQEPPVEEKEEQVVTDDDNTEDFWTGSYMRVPDNYYKGIQFPEFNAQLIPIENVHANGAHEITSDMILQKRLEEANNDYHAALEADPKNAWLTKRHSDLNYITPQYYEYYLDKLNYYRDVEGLGPLSSRWRAEIDTARKRNGWEERDNHEFLEGLRQLWLGDQVTSSPMWSYELYEKFKKPTVKTNKK